MGLTHQDIFQRYLYAGAISRDPAAIAALFTEDGVYEAPLVAADHPLRRLVGQAAIRSGTSRYHQQQPPAQSAMNAERSTSVLHDTTDPDVFMAEIDVAFDHHTVSLLWIFRLRGDRIAHFRDYFTDPRPADAAG